MNKIDRRRFIKDSSKGIAGAVAISSGLASLSFLPATGAEIDSVKFGNTGLNVPRLAFGTGSGGWKKTSNQKKLGEKNFVKLARHAFDRGVKFFETADMYGTHQFVGKAMKEVGRENVRLLTKVMVYQHQDWYTPESFQKSLDRFRKELDTDYVDFMLLHCMVNTEWPDEYKRYMDDFSKAKQKGIIKRVGLSCHDLGALKLAAESSWADMILARINYQGPRMDGPPADVMPVLKRAKENGKGVLGMKIFGCGELIQPGQREKSLNYVLNSGNVHAMTIGFESTEQVDDAVERIMRIINS